MVKINNSRTKTYLILIILVIAAILRFNHITQPFVDTFSWRQASTAMMADNFYRRNWNIFYPEISWDGPAPSYNGREFQTVSYLAALIYLVVGQHDWVGRSIAAIFGIWGIYALYRLVRLVWDEERALVSAAVMALLPGSIFTDRSFLPDPVMVSLVTTSCWMLVSYLQTNSWKYLVLAGTIGTLGFLTKIPGLIIGIPMLYAVAAILGYKQALHPKRLLPILVTALLSIPTVIAYYLWARHLALTYPPYHFAGSSNWLWNNGLNNWFEQKYYLPEFFAELRWSMWTYPVIALVGLGIIFPPPQERQEQKSSPNKQLTTELVKPRWLFHWWIFACAIYYLIGARQLVSNPWNIHLFSPAAAALAGHALISIAAFLAKFVRKFAQPFVPLIFILITLLTIGNFSYKNLKYMYAPFKDESYKLGLTLREISQPGDLVVTMASQLGDPNVIYYSQRRGWTFPPAIPTIDWSKLPENDQDSIAMFEQLRNKGADWLAIADERKKDFWQYHPVLVDYINKNCELKKKTSAGVIYRILSPQELEKKF